MGLRFRKSIKIAPGIKFNINKNSVGMTFGIRGAHYTVNSKGKKTASVGIPGTGLSYTQSTGGSSSKSNSSKSCGSGNNGGGCLITCLKALGILILIPLVMAFGWIAGIIWFAFFRKKITDDQKKKKYTIWVAIGSVISLLIFISSVSSSSNSEDVPVYTESAETTTESAGDSEVCTETEETATEMEYETGLIEGETQIDSRAIETESVSSENGEQSESTSNQATEPPVIASEPEKEVQSEQQSEPQIVEESPTQSASDQSEMVWVDDTAEKYHRKQDCSGMDNAYQVTKEQAESMGKGPCGRCYK